MNIAIREEKKKKKKKYRSRASAEDGVGTYVVASWRRQSSVRRSCEQTCSNHRPAGGQACAARAGQGRHQCRSRAPQQTVSAACDQIHRCQPQSANLLSSKKQRCCKEKWPHPRQLAKLIVMCEQSPMRQSWSTHEASGELAGASETPVASRMGGRA